MDRANRLWVADGQSGEVRIFESDGSHWKTRGGRGEGPGEFRQIRLLGSAPGDTVVLGDGGLNRLTVFSPEGELVRTETLPTFDGATPRPFGVFSDGSVLGQVPRMISAAAIEPGQLLNDTAALVRIDRGASTASPYATAPGPLWIWTGRSQIPMPFTVNASFVATGTAVALVSGADFRIRLFESGELRKVFAVDRDRRSVGSDELASYRSFVQQDVPEQMRPDYLTAMEHERRPSALPAYDRVLVSASGEVWAQIYDPDIIAPHDWDVFDEDGRFLGNVHVPGGMFPLVITESSVVGNWRDALGVEHVRAYSWSR